ncbi:hypothetical protein [Fibrobacter sp. UWB11]|nr:hypothetical protein [Fibrobacter sp. UWB11]
MTNSSKKDYVAPEVKVVVLEQQEPLLQSSHFDPPDTILIYRD